MSFSNITITHSPYSKHIITCIFVIILRYTYSYNCKYLYFLFQMKNSKYFKDIFKSIPDYKKIVLLIYLFQNDENLLNEIGFSKADINSLNLEFKNIFLQEYETYLYYIKNEEESLLEKILDK